MRVLPDRNLAYPVLITTSNGGSGSGFFLNAGPVHCFVTARHVLCDPKTGSLLSDQAELLSYGRDPSDNVPQVLLMDLQQLNAQKAVHIHDTYDIVTVELGTLEQAAPDAYKLTWRREVVKKSEPLSGTVSVPYHSLKVYAEVLISNDVFIFGYPTSLGLKNVPQIDYSRPLLRRGIVAGKNDTTRSVILDCPVYPGNSGGVVIEVERIGPDTYRHWAIGVVSQFVPLTETWINTTFGHQNTSITNSGYSIATAMDALIELIAPIAGPKPPPPAQPLSFSVTP